MKTLLLMRHAKSSWKHLDLTDPERPLNKRGRKDAPLMGALIRERELVPQIILSSSAIRARETAQAVAENFSPLGTTQYLDQLYMAEPETYIEVLRTLPDDLERVMIIGHNPGLEMLLQVLARRIEALPTAVVAYVSLPIDKWSELNGESQGEVVEIWRPRDVRKEEVSEKEKKGKKKKDKSS